MKKNFILAAFCSIFLTLSANIFAQDSIVVAIATKPYKTKMYTLSPGYAFVDVSGLNRFLIPGTPGFNEHFGVLGFESTSECKRFVYGWTLQAGRSAKNTAIDYAGVPGNNMDYHASFGNFLIHGGYSIISTERVKFYPILGAGLGGFNGNYSRVDNQSIAQFSNDPGVQGSVTKYMGCFDGALGLDILFPMKKLYVDGSCGSVLGIRVGYTQNVGMGDWRFASARILENPTYNPGLVYAKIQFGLFRTINKKYIFKG